MQKNTKFLGIKKDEKKKKTIFLGNEKKMKMQKKKPRKCMDVTLEQKRSGFVDLIIDELLLPLILEGAQKPPRCNGSAPTSWRSWRHTWPWRLKRTVMS